MLVCGWLGDLVGACLGFYGFGCLVVDFLVVGLFNRFGIIVVLLFVACLWSDVVFVWFVGGFCWFLFGLVMVLIASAFCFAVGFAFGVDLLVLGCM